MQKYSVGLFLVLSVLAAGCTTQAFGVDSIVQATPAVKTFLADYPNAKLTTSLLDESTVSAQLETIKADCEGFREGSYYKTILNDPDSNTKLTVWTDSKSFEIVCVIKESAGGARTPISPQTAETIQPSTTTSPPITSQPTTTVPPTTQQTTTTSAAATTTTAPTNTTSAPTTTTTRAAIGTLAVCDISSCPTCTGSTECTTAGCTWNVTNSVCFNPAATTTTTTSTIPAPLNNRYIIGQTFKPSKSSYLTKVGLYLRGTDRLLAGLLPVEVRSGGVEGPVIASKSINVTSIPVNPYGVKASPTTIIFDTTPALTANNTYAILIKSDSSWVIKPGYGGALIIWDVEPNKIDGEAWSHSTLNGWQSQTWDKEFTIYLSSTDCTGDSTCHLGSTPDISVYGPAGAGLADGGGDYVER